MDKEAREQIFRDAWRKVQEGPMNDVFQAEIKAGQAISELLKPLLPIISFPPEKLITEAQEFMLQVKSGRLNEQLDVTAVMSQVISGQLDNDEHSAARADQNLIDKLMLFTQRYSLARTNDGLISAIIISGHNSGEGEALLKNGQFFHFLRGKTAQSHLQESSPLVIRRMYPLDTPRDSHLVYARATQIFDAILRLNELWNFAKLQEELEALKARHPVKSNI